MIDLIIDTPGGSNFAGYHLRNVGSLHVGGSGIASHTLQVTGTMLISGAVTFNGGVTFVGAVTTGSITTGAITSGLINGQTISAAANFTGTVTVAGLSTFNGNVTITGQITSLTHIAPVLVFGASNKIALEFSAANGLDISESGVTPNVRFPKLGGITVLRGDIIVGTIHRGTADGADNAVLALAGGGAGGTTRGGTIYLAGNEAAGVGGFVQITAGDVAGSRIEFYTGPLTLRGYINAVGSLIWNGPIVSSGFISVAPTVSVYLDGGGDTSIRESSANVISLTAGGVVGAYVNASGLTAINLIVPAGNTIYLDGGSDTYIRESVANIIQFFCGGVSAGGFNNSVAATAVRLLVFDVDTGITQQVSVGPANSGGAGFKYLRIPN